MSAATLLAMQRPVLATDGFNTFWGLARPPTSYGAYAGDNKDAAKYAFEYPAGWKVETVGKNEKGMQGIDSRVRNVKNKGQSAYLVTFGRAGEDNKKFKLGDIEQTLQGFAGADYDLQDALTESTDKKSTTREVDGQTFYDYELCGPANNYLATVTLKEGKVYAFFVKSPAKSYSGDESTLRSIVQSFRTV
ncbi:g1787 [Coccomyxa elongata]